MKRLMIILALFATVLTAIAQSNDKALMDSLRREVNKMSHGEARLKKAMELVSVSQLSPEGINDAMILLIIICMTIISTVWHTGPTMV